MDSSLVWYPEGIKFKHVVRTPLRNVGERRTGITLLFVIAGIKWKSLPAAAGQHRDACGDELKY